MANRRPNANRSPRIRSKTQKLLPRSPDAASGCYLGDDAGLRTVRGHDGMGLLRGMSCGAFCGVISPFSCGLDKDGDDTL
jgi:hypothetical protein